MTIRGRIELTARTYSAYQKRLKVFKKKLYYASFPVVKTNAARDVLIERDGTRKQLCF